MVGSRFPKAWKLHNFGDSFKEKRYKMTNTKLGMDTNIYIEWEKKLIFFKGQQI